MSDEIELIKACPATLLPWGEKVLLSKGSRAKIFGGVSDGCEIVGAFGLARVDRKNFDSFSVPPTTSVPSGALCEKKSAKAASGRAEKAGEPAFGEPNVDELWEAAKTVYDPEIPVNIVDLGLVYRLEVLKRDDGKYCVDSDMTLTAPGCSLGPVIADELKMRFESMPNIAEARVNIVWEPPWNSDMISEEGKMTLGLI